MRVVPVGGGSLATRRKGTEWVAVSSLAVVFLGLTAVTNLTFINYQQFMELSRSFLDGRLSFGDTAHIPWGINTALAHGRYYWPSGPFPAIVLLPFVFTFDLIGQPFYQGYLQFFLTLITFFACLRLAEWRGYCRSDALWLAFAFCFASVYQFVALAPYSWYFAQVLAVCLTFLALLEYFTQKRYGVIGTLLGLVFLTRVTAGFVALFFIAEIVSDAHRNVRERVRDAAFLLLPIVLSGFLLLAYNEARFGTLLESGYGLAPGGGSLFALANIPVNFYSYFLKPVDVSSTFPFLRLTYPGASFFLISPIFLYLLGTNTRERIVRCAVPPIVIVLLLLLSFRWPGWLQTGPRYLLDLLPLAFLLLLFSFPGSRLTTPAKACVVLSAFLNLYLTAVLFFW